MSYLIGVDEAGYGPNLGPLIITATVWQLPTNCQPRDVAPTLRPHVSAPGELPVSPLVIGDSKALYKAGGTLEPLERVVLGAAVLQGLPCGTWRRLWNALAPDDSLAAVFHRDLSLGPTESPLESEPWYSRYELDLPVDSDPQDVLSAATAWHATFEATNVGLTAVRTLAIFPSAWNQLLRQYGGKGEVLSRATLGLVLHCLQQFSLDGDIFVQCDKHGGRSKYVRLLQQTFPEHLVEVYKEQSDESVYRMGPSDHRMEFRFTAKGDRSLACGLASMVSKYLRELAMVPFNTFWQNHLPDLRPTAGYPVDAKRFHREIRPMQMKLGIADHTLWRDR